MAECVLMKAGGGADLDAVTASAADVVAPKVIIGQEGESVTGIMLDRGNWSSTELAAGASVTIPAGKHGGGGKVTAKSLAAQTAGTATAGDIITGKTAWINGTRVAGSIADYRRTTTKIDAIRINNNRFEVAVAAGAHGYSWANNGYEYMDFSQVASALGLTSDKIKKGVTICGIKGTFEGWVPTVNDLYLRGNNVAGLIYGKYFGWSYANGKCSFDSGQISITGSAVLSVFRYGCLCSTRAYNLSGYNNFNITFRYVNSNNQSILNIMRISYGSDYNARYDGYIDLEFDNIHANSGSITKTINISSVNATKYLGVYIGGTNMGSSGAILAIDRIWLS